MIGLDASILMHPDVWRASGHAEHFSDPLVDCRECRQRWRADPLEEPVCPNCGGELTEPRQFNQMLTTHLGPVQDDAGLTFLRPETAQGIFVNFNTAATASRRKPPFGIAQIGKAFRNEITTGNFIFRTREFEMMEIEFFVEPGEDERWHESWIADCVAWYTLLGLDEGASSAPPTRSRRAVPLLEGDHGRRVPVPMGLGRDSGHRQPHRLRPARPRRGVRRTPRILRRRGPRARRAIRHRALSGRGPGRHGLPGGRVHRGGEPQCEGQA